MIALFLGSALAVPSWQAGAQYNVIGGHTGLEASALWGEGANRLRLGLALTSNIESIYAPATLGWQGSLMQEHRAGPLLGAGLQAQYFWSTNMKPVVRPALTVDLGLALRTERGALGIAVSPDLALLTEPGPGLAVRVFFSPEL